jgi:general secretion pathway protein D
VLKYWLLFVASVSFSLAATDPTAEALARAAQKAQNAGQLVRAYMLYAEAAARDPKNEKYRVNRDGLKPLAQLLSKAGVEKEPSRDELLSSVSNDSEEPLRELEPAERLEMAKLLPPPSIVLAAGRHSFHARADERTLYETIARAYGISVVFDPQFQPQPNVSLDLDDVDAKQALGGVAEATNTFLFPIAAQAIFVARDTLQKRDEYEPQVAVTVPLPEVTDPKEMTEASNAVRQAFELRHIGMDSAGNAIVIRDRISRANAARSLLETLIRPPAQVAIDVQIYEVDDNRTLQYGLSLPNAFPMINLGAGSQTLISIPSGFVNFLTFGGGATLFGIGLTNANAFATYSKSHATSIYDATVVVSSGQTAQWHVGDKYPFPTTLSTGTAQLANPIAGFLPQIQMVDLGVVIKVKPEMHADGDISMDVHAEYQALGTQTFNTVPEILNRQFEGSVRLHTGEWAILAGLDSQTTTVTRNGIAGLSDIPAIGDLFTDINKTQQRSQTLVVLKPHPLSETATTDRQPVYLGGGYGRKVLL